MSLWIYLVFDNSIISNPDGFILYLCQLLLNFQGAQALIQVRSLSNYKTGNRLRVSEIFGDEGNYNYDGFSKLLFLLSFFSYTAPHDNLKKVLDREISRHCNNFPEDVTYLGQVLNVNIVKVNEHKNGDSLS